MIRVLFVCMGNICRSPMGHGVFEDLVESAGLSGQISVDSAGTHAYHVGEPPDARAREAAGRRGYELAGQRARLAESSDLEVFDYVLAMDRDNLAHLRQMAGPEATAQVQLLLDFAATRAEKEVPDPYYGSHSGFDRALDLIEEAAEGLLQEIRARHRI